MFFSSSATAYSHLVDNTGVWTWKLKIICNSGNIRIGVTQSAKFANSYFNSENPSISWVSNNINFIGQESGTFSSWFSQKIINKNYRTNTLFKTNNIITIILDNSQHCIRFLNNDKPISSTLHIFIQYLFRRVCMCFVLFL